MRNARRWTITIMTTAALMASGVTPPAHAAFVSDWQRGVGIELESVSTDGAGSPVVTGSVDLPDAVNAGFVIRKYDDAGNVIWTRTWHPQRTRVTGTDVAVSVDENDAVYVVGEIARANLEGGGYFLRKYSRSGRLRWSRVSRGGYVSGPEVPEIATGVAVSGRHVIVVGHTYGCCGSAADDGWVRSFRPDGSLRWERNFEARAFDRNTNDVALEVAVDARGAYVVGSVEEERRVDLSERVDTELVVQKLSLSGRRRWEYVLRDRDVRDDDGGTDVALGGGVYVVGDVNGKRFSQGEGFAARFDRDGRLDWRRTWGEPADGIAPSGVAVTTLGPVITGSIADPDDATLDVFLRRIDADGSFAEQVVDDRARSVAATAIASGLEGDVFVSGWAERADATHAGRVWRWLV